LPARTLAQLVRRLSTRARGGDRRRGGRRGPVGAATPGASRVSAPNISAVITTNRTIATVAPPGMNALILDGQSTDGRTNQARNESRPFHGVQQSAVGDGVSV